MDEPGVAQDDHGSGTHFESENGAVLLPEVIGVLEEWFSGAGKLEEVADNRPSRRTGREIGVLGFGLVGEQED